MAPTAPSIAALQPNLRGRSALKGLRMRDRATGVPRAWPSERVCRRGGAVVLLSGASATSGAMDGESEEQPSDVFFRMKNTSVPAQQHHRPAPLHNAAGTNRPGEDESLRVEPPHHRSFGDASDRDRVRALPHVDVAF